MFIDKKVSYLQKSIILIKKYHTFVRYNGQLRNYSNRMVEAFKTFIKMLLSNEYRG